MQLYKGFQKSVIAFSLVAAIALYAGATPISAATIAELKEQKAALAAEETEAGGILAAVKDDVAQKQNYLLSLQEQIAETEAQTDEVVALVSQLEKSTGESEKKIAEAQLRADENYRQLREGLTGVDLGESLNDLKNLMGSISFESYAADALKPASKEIAEAAAAFSEDLEYIADRTAVNEVNRRELSNRQKELESNRKKLDALYAEAEKQLEKAELNRDGLEKDARQVSAEKEKTESAIDTWHAAYLAEQERVNGFSFSNLSGAVLEGKGLFVWPIPGYSDITCYFGEGGHRGVDVSGGEIYGKAIVSAASGTVAYAGWMGTYGNVVFVDHGNGFQTRYAHMSAIGCAEGDAVEQNQVIGFVGSTGNSTGPHLHFEVLYGENLTNPFDYF